MAGWEVRPSGPDRSGRVRVLVLLLLLALPAAFYAGMQWQLQQAESIAAEIKPMAKRIAEQESQLDDLHAQMAIAVSGASVAEKANEQNRLTIKLLEEQIFKEQQDLSFYKGVLAPASRREGLRIRKFELQATENPQRFRYKLLLSRVGKDDKPLNGQLHITVEGSQGAKDKVVLELSSLTDDEFVPFKDKLIPYTFKHFKSIPEAGRFAELELPDGFEPNQIRVRAEIKGEKPLERTFKWLDKE
ncbi:DUF6776 family protein [Pseudomonas sp. EL_65y_Pfl2_R95]|uniref:DUF6776 family protein n=1 Tax=Pseudomonas sp. EL_65y_Pfl2_R95 TaxID=3088698 RepID=UPI0030DA63B3